MQAALSARIAKTDRNDACGMANLLRMGWFRPVHVKTMDAREQRALLATRPPSAAGCATSRTAFAVCCAASACGHPACGAAGTLPSVIAGYSSLPDIIEPLLKARTALRDQLAVVDKRLLSVARQDPVCHRLMTVPGVGAIVALTFRAAIDQPERFRSSKSVAPVSD